MDLSPDEDNFQGRLLHQAALWDNVELLQELLTGMEPYAVDARDPSGRTALHAAALADRSRCLRALLQAGADVDAVCHDSVGGKTALHLASERGHVENILCLVSFGAEPLRRDAAGDSALALAERHGHRHAARTLREAVDALERERLSQHTQLRELMTRGDINQLRAKLTDLGRSAGIVVNMTPNGANTLLYVASEAGFVPGVSLLLSHGADGRAHPVTKYSPLYIAAYHGHMEIAKMLLEHFPEAVQQETVEKWLPIHAACIGGHANLVTLILEHEYPENLLSTYTDVTSQWQYKAAFDVNAVDVSGQTALYVACTLGNVAVVDALLNYTVDCTRVSGQVEDPPPPSVSAAPPPRAGISLGIHAIVNKLTGAASKKAASSTSHRIRPVRVDAGRGCDSCVGCAAQHGHARLLRHLLRAGASADAAAAAPPPHPPDNQDGNTLSSRARRRSRSASATASRNDPSPARYGDDRDGPWTALAVAARAKNVQIAELLLAHGAHDAHGRALRECVRHGLHELIPAILATKAYPDPEYKLNKSALSEAVLNGQNADSTLTYSALCPTAPVILNWRDLRCNATTLRMSWLSAGCLKVNPRVCGAATATATATALRALTRLDVANNDLRTLPPELFTMISIRYINAAQNKLERLPTPTDAFEDDFDAKGRKVKRKGKRPAVYSAPALQELYLQDNRLEEVPASLFSLPALTTLDVSNNKLRALPPALWTAPHLRDLNAALNHLKELPAHAHAANTHHEEGVTSPTAPSTPPAHCNNQKSWSRSPSIERSESEGGDGDVPTLGDRAGNAVWSAPVRVHTWRGAVCAGDPPPPGRGGPSGGGAMLSTLNLSHNQFSCVPAPLACLAPNLTRLNMAYNSLRSMSYVTSYPISLRQLDLSHNEITCWPSLPQLENFGPGEDPLACYCPKPVTPTAGSRRPNSHTSVREQLLQAACPARRHLRLEGLRTLILSNNLLTRIQLTTDDDGEPPPVSSDNDNDDDEWSSRSQLKGRLLFPLLSMLDVSCNLLRCVPPAIHELTNLAVLNLSGNKDITSLPPQMGLLSRVWNLSVRGCRLPEPLRLLAEAPGARSAHLLGYLKSVLQEAKPYARMKLMLTGVQGIGKTSLLECLRQESALQHRRKPTEHWAKRMGNKSSRRGNMSTVGVDIGTWVYEKHRSSKGPVTFRTWDFGGQHEYYATHQYFLSRRSLYLVLWKVTDGRKGLAAAVEWLRSIQARAPGSPVIMVATHYDQVVNSNLPENESPEALQRTIRSCIMGASDADKLGLPRVLDSVEVSCSTRHNIRLLADIIYSVAFSVKPPGSKEPLLEQLVPATYLALEECVTSLAHDLRDPVLRHDDYKRLVTQYMQQKNLRMFRDAAELHQATMFLHENGVILHYDDATLKELYFLKPQWLCDVLAHVVTVREINPFACNGIMKLDDLAHVFKASPQLARGEEASALGLSLLNKFELALCWDARTLLVPPLLPEAEPAVPQLPLRPSSWCSTTRAWPLAVPVLDSHVRTDSPTLVHTLTKEMKINKWKELHGMAQALGLVPATKDYTYTRDTFWQNMRKLAVKKRDNSRKTGSGKVIITKIDDAVYDIIGKDTPTLDVLPVEESFSSLLTSSQPSTTNESSCTTSQPLNTASTSSQQQISIEKENIPPKRNKKEEENLGLKN